MMAVKRVNDGALGGFERCALAWMARRLSFRITPDHLTAIGLTGALSAAAGYVASSSSIHWLWLACAGLLLNWAGDSLDGTVARLRRIERPRYGFFVDHTSDLFAQSMIFVALGLSPCTHFSVACLGLIAFLMAFVYSLICATVSGTLRITYFGFGPTEIRALLVAGNLLTLWTGSVPQLGQWFAVSSRFATVTIYEFVIVAIAAFMVAALAALALRERAALARPHAAARSIDERASVSAPVSAALSPK
jgi:archaetidylinositol phosphate synthase